VISGPSPQPQPRQHRALWSEARAELRSAALSLSLQRQTLASTLHATLESRVAPMDAFRTLTGGSTFDRKRFAGDMNHFQVRSGSLSLRGKRPHASNRSPCKQKQAPLASTSTAVAAPSLPAELDFFASSSAPAPSKKRKRTAATATSATTTAEDLPSATETQHDYAALLRKHKIKLTGLDLPEPVASVDDLVARRRTKSQQADASSTNDAVKRIANNWRALGYNEPTGVQMAAWGTMLAVSPPFSGVFSRGRGAD
jgi:hypothetical protein